MSGVVPERAIERLQLIERREIADRSLTPGEAHDLLAYIGESQLHGLTTAALLLQARHALHDARWCRAETGLCDGCREACIDALDAIESRGSDPEVVTPTEGTEQS